LLDVRDDDEYAKARIDGSVLVPLSELEARLAELEDWRDRRIVAHCYKGTRSASACKLLLAAGFADVSNLIGGIDAWSLTVDPEVPRY